MSIYLKSDWKSVSYDIHLAVSFEPKHTDSLLSDFGMEWKQDKLRHLKNPTLSVLTVHTQVGFYPGHGHIFLFQLFKRKTP